MHILSPETDKCPSWICVRENMKVFHDQSSQKNVANPAGVEPTTSLSPVRHASNQGWLCQTYLYRMLICKLIILSGMDTLSGEATLWTMSLPPFLKGSTLKGKNLLPLGVNSFLLEQTPRVFLVSQKHETWPLFDWCPLNLHLRETSMSLKICNIF